MFPKSYRAIRPIKQYDKLTLEMQTGKAQAKSCSFCQRVMMPSFRIDQTTLRISKALLSPELVQNLRGGFYEKLEAKALELHLSPDDRVLEIGSGVGYMAILAAKIVGGENVVTVEANPALLPEIQNNLTLNKINGVTLLNFAVVSNPEQRQIELFIGEAFWGASVNKPMEEVAKAVMVPALGFDQLLAQYPANVLICDVEGAEIGYFQNPLPEGLQTIVLEIHPETTPPIEIKALFDRLSGLGFGYAPKGSNGQVVCFKRVE